VAYDLAALSSYVRFYQTVTQQIAAAWRKLADARAAMHAALAPFAEPLSPLSSAALSAVAAAPPGPPPALAGLWQAEEPEALVGLTDVYEVVAAARVRSGLSTS
jgi:hypothetical protein